MNTENTESMGRGKAGALSRADIARRHVLLKGLGKGAAAATVLTVGPRSAMATVACLSPSASASINLTHSRPGRSGGSCANGRTPGFWQNASSTHPADWASSGAEGKLFSVCFLSGFSGKTLKQVMGMNGNEDPQQFGAHLSAAWCNLQMGWVDSTVLSLEVLRAMWAGQNNYSPIPGVFWTRGQTVTYLKTTMPL
ncbi:MAG: hypothetical protein IPO43_02530 [Rhodoferax sp.]|nr:hypothetical protein [Rhodoferax sp.]